MRYDKPTQVLFADEEGTTFGGIAYNNIIICGCCGGIFEVDEVEILENYDWIDISHEIIGN